MESEKKNIKKNKDKKDNSKTNDKLDKIEKIDKPIKLSKNKHSFTVAGKINFYFRNHFYS